MLKLKNNKCLKTESEVLRLTVFAFFALMGMVVCAES